MIFIFLDFDECSNGTDTCSHNCTNVDGGYNCFCPAGKTLGSDQRTCEGEKIQEHILLAHTSHAT